MTRDGHKLKETGIRLLLSSRAEMQKVIETARQQTVSVFQLNPAPIQAPPVAAALMPNPQLLLAQQMIRQQLPYSTHIAPMAAVSAAVAVPPRLDYPIGQLQQRAPAILNHLPVAPAVDHTANQRDRRRSRSRSRDRSTSRDRSRRNRSRSRSRSRERSTSYRRRRDRRSYSRDRDYDSDDSDSRGSKRRSVTPPKAKEPVQVWENQTPFDFRAVYNNGGSNEGPVARPGGHSSSVELQRLRDRRNEAQRPPVETQEPAIDLTEDDHNCCVKVTNLAMTTGYKDLRQFFQGQSVRQNGLKMINDELGKRSGVAYVRFHRPESRKFAMMRNGQMLKGHKITVVPMTDQEFEEGVDSYRPPINMAPTHSQAQLAGNQNGGSTVNGGGGNNPVQAKAGQPLVFDQILFTCLKVTDVPTLTTEQDIMKYFSEYGLMHIIIAKDKQKRNCAFLKLNRAEDAKRALQEKNLFSMGNKKVVVTMCSEAVFDDVMHSIANEESTQQQQQQENRSDSPRDKNNRRAEKRQAGSRWGEKVDEPAQKSPLISPAAMGSPDNNSMTKERNSRWGGQSQAAAPMHVNSDGPLNPILSQLNLALPLLSSLLPQAAAALGNGSHQSQQQLQHQQQQQQPQQPVAVSRDPRLKNISMNSAQNNNSNNNSMSNQRSLADPRGNQNFNQNSDRRGESDCVVVSNLDPAASDLDVAAFFSKAGIVPLRVHILLNTSGKPSGDAFVEFSKPNDAHAALLQNERLLGNKPVFVESIPREQVDDVLSSFGVRHGNRNSNGGGPGVGAQQQPFNQLFGAGAMARGPNPRMPMQRLPFMGEQQQQQPRMETCVLALNNVPYRSGVEDIISFFSGYDIRPQDVMRRFNDAGQPTAEAKVRFKSPAEAKSAFEEKKFGKMSGRSIFLEFDH